MERLKSIFLLFKDALVKYFRDRASIYAAGLAYYMVFSLVPLLVFTTALAGLFIGRSAAGEQIALQLQYLVGDEMAGFITDAMDVLMNRTMSATLTVISIAVLLFTAGGVFRQLRVAIDSIWGIVDVPPRNAREWLTVARYRAIPSLMVFVFGILLSLAMVMETGIKTVRSHFELLFPALATIEPQFGRLLIPTLTFITFLLVFKFIPDAHSRWRDAAVGSLVTTALFLVGRVVLAIFLAFSSTGSIFGAAGSIVILLFWIYYSSQILLYGAEFMWLYAQRHGEPIRPNRISRILEMGYDDPTPGAGS